MRRAFVFLVVVTTVPLALSALAGENESAAEDQPGTTVESAPSAPPPVTDPVEEEPLPPVDDAMWWLLGVSASIAMVLLLVHVWTRDGPEEAERDLTPVRKG